MKRRVVVGRPPDTNLTPVYIGMGVSRVIVGSTRVRNRLSRLTDSVEVFSDGRVVFHTDMQEYVMELIRHELHKEA